MKDRKPSSRSGWPVWLRLLVALLVVAALIAPLWVWREQIDRVFVAPERVAAEVRDAGPWGPLVVIALSVGQTLVAPIPGQGVNFVAGYLFGLGLGLLYSWLGLVLGTVLAMGLARLAGRPLVARLVDSSLLDRASRLVAGRGLGFFLVCFLVPGLPDDLLCFVAGLTTLPLRLLLPIAAFGRFPGLFAAVWLGSNADQLPWQGWLLLALVSVLALLAAWRYGERLQRVLLSRLQRHTGVGKQDSHDAH